MNGPLKDQTVLVIGRGSGLARAINAISPGVIDTGAWDALGQQGKTDYFSDISACNPARRIGTPEDIAQGVLFAMTNSFLTGQTLHIDGGEPLT
jgi:NAD(P)-dependent dehydrogenase (short-subunit alcohol dehydrogenase family)